MISKLLESLGGSEKLEIEYPTVYSAIKKVKIGNEDDYTTNPLNDNASDNYVSIEEVYSMGDGIGVVTGCNFLERKSIIITSVLIKEKQTKKIIDSFTTYNENKSFIEERFVSNNKMARKYNHEALEVDATFTWSDKGIELTELNKVLNTEQYYNGNPIITDIKVKSPRAKDGKKTIILYDRTPFSGENPDYTYKDVVSSDKKSAILHIPFSGGLIIDKKFNINGLMNDPEGPELYIKFENGGTLTYDNSEGIIPQFKIDSSENTVSWDFNDDWVSKIDLTRFHAETIVDFVCKFTLALTLKNDNSVVFHPVVMINSVENQRIYSNVVEIEKINIRWGCVAKSTSIKMFDGSDKLVEDVVIGDKVKTDTGYSTVKDVIVGTEKEMIYISDYNGKSVKVTDNHPVKTLRGYIPANNLNAADILVTLDGDSQIKDLFTEDYNDEVYSLDLDPSGGIYCNGILTGDFEIQNSYESSRKTELKEPTSLQIEFDKLINGLNK